jgi:NADH:ubiquinone oxidoreductase subunit K
MNNWSRVALGTVILVISSLFLLSFVILALISPSHFQTQRDQIFVILTILVAVSGISLILSGKASKKEK